MKHCLSIASLTGPTTYDVYGVITFDGKPIPFGAIQFIPDEKQGNSGPNAFAEIIDGKYDTKTIKKGTVGGPHTIRITGMSAKPVERTDPDAVIPDTKLFQEFQTTFDFPKKPTEFSLDIPKPAK